MTETDNGFTQCTKNLNKKRKSESDLWLNMKFAYNVNINFYSNHEL